MSGTPRPFTRTQKVALTALYLALSMTAFLLESLLPPPVPLVPWAKYGFANIFVLLALFTLGSWQAVLVLLAKCAFGGFFSGFLSVWYSLSAGLLSLLLGVLLYETCYRFFSLTAISAVCAAFHNLVQICMAAVLMSSPGLLWFGPLSAAVGLCAGLVTGLASYFVLRVLRKRVVFR